MSVGYSKRSLIEKLGLKPEMTVVIINLPENYEIKADSKITGEIDFGQIFVKSRSELEKLIPKFEKHLSKTGMLWVSWPKKSSKIQTDLNENLLREIILPTGLVDVKVIAVDEVWSGLKFVWRLSKR